MRPLSVITKNSAVVVLGQDDEHRELLEGKYIYVPGMGTDVHLKI